MRVQMQTPPPTPGVADAERTVLGAPPPRRPAWRPDGDVWLPAFVGGQMIFQLVLLTSAGGVFRVALRTAAFLISIAFLFLLRRSEGPSHPSSRVAIWILV